LVLEVFRDYNEINFKNAERIIITACGTSWHAGLVAEITSFEELPEYR